MESSESGQKIIRFGLKVEVQQFPPKRIPRSSDWAAFRETLRLNVSRVGQIDSNATPSGLESRLSVLNQFIIDAYHCDYPLKTITKKRNCPWWSGCPSELRKTVRRLFNKAKRTGNWKINAT